MKNLETNYTENVLPQNSEWIVESYTQIAKKRVHETLWQKVSNDLTELFWIEKVKIIQNTKKETKEISNKNELNEIELQLAKIFWKVNQMKKLIKRPLSLAYVMQNYEE